MFKILSQLKLSTKLVIPVAVLTLVLAGVVWVAAKALENLADSNTRIVNISAAKKMGALNISNGLNEASSEVRGAILETDMTNAQGGVKRFKEALGRTLDEVDKLMVLADTSESRESLVLLKQAITGYGTLAQRAGDFALTNKHDDAVRLIMGDVKIERAKTKGFISNMLEASVKELEKDKKDGEELYRRTLIILFSVSAGGLLLGIILSILIIRSVTIPVRAMTLAMGRLAQGDGTVEIPALDNRDEIGEMAKAMNVFKGNAEMIATMLKAEGVTKEIGLVIEKAAAGDLTARVRLDDKSGFLRDVGAQVNNLLVASNNAIKEFGINSKKTAISVGEASIAVGQVSDGARSQMASLVKVAGALNESAQAIKMVADNSRSASDKAESAQQNVQRGQAAVERLVPVISSISQNSRKINQITQVIAQIANHTHILSLNAAIEAARAGEHGKGFVVVAQEVGKLAESAAQNAKQIGDIVEQATLDAQEGKVATDLVRETIGSVAGEVNQTTQMIRSIAVAMEEQQAIIEQIDSNVSDLRGIASTNSAASEEITATMIQLSQLADGAKERSAQFKTL